MPTISAFNIPNNKPHTLPIKVMVTTPCGLRCSLRAAASTAVTDAGRQPKGHDAMVMPMNRLKSKYVARGKKAASPPREGASKKHSHIKMT